MRLASLAAWLPSIQAIDAVTAGLSARDRGVITRYLVEVTDALGRSLG